MLCPGIDVDLELKGSAGSRKKSTVGKASGSESTGKTGRGSRGGKRNR